MEISKLKEGTKLTVSIVGRLDTITSKDLEASMKEELSGIKDITFDLSNVDYISSSGLRLFLVYSKTIGGKDHLFINGANAVIKEIFSATAFNNFATIS